MAVLGGVLVVVCFPAAAISGGVFLARFRYRRRATRWMGIPTPISSGMWATAAILGLAEAGVVLGIVLLILGIHDR